MARKILKRRGRFEIQDEFTGAMRDASVEELSEIRLDLDPTTHGELINQIDGFLSGEPKRQTTQRRRVGTKRRRRDPLSSLNLPPLTPGQEKRKETLELAREAKPERTLSGLFDRWKIKNFMTHPGAIKPYLEGKGFEVREIPDRGILDSGFNAIYRKGPDAPWTILDPPGFGPFGADLAFDLLDLTADAAQDVAIGKATLAGGAAGGLGGAALAGGGAAVGTEIVRQAVGQHILDTPDNMDLLQTGVFGVFAALTPPGVALTRKAFQFARASVGTAGDVLLEFGGRLSGARRVGAMSRADILRARARDVAGVGEKLPSFKEVTDDILDALELIGDPETMPFAERMHADMILDQAKDQVVSIQRHLGELQAMAAQRTIGGARKAAAVGGKEAVRAAEAGIKSKASLGQAEEILQRIDVLFMSQNNGLGVDPSRVPIQIAEDFKRTIQDAAFISGAFQGQQMEKPLRNVLQKLGAGVRNDIEQIADATGFAGANNLNYSQNMALVAEKTRAINKLKKVVKLGDQDPIASGQRLETFLAGAFSDKKTNTLDGLRMIEQQTGIKIVGPAKRALIGTAFGDEGVAAVAPQLTPTGNVMGAALIGAPGFALGGPVGSAAAIAGGAMAASPRNILRMTRGVLRLKELSEPVSRTAARAARIGTVGQPGTRIRVRPGSRAAVREQVEERNRKRREQEKAGRGGR